MAGQVVTFGSGAGDPLGLNQLDPALDILGTINQLKATAPVNPMQWSWSMARSSRRRRKRRGYA